jgi:hypothetical protein
MESEKMNRMGLYAKATEKMLEHALAHGLFSFCKQNTIRKDFDVLEKNFFEGNKKGPCGPDGYAIHLRITGLII